MSRRQVDPSANVFGPNPQTILVNANYTCAPSDTNVCVQTAGVTVTLAPNPTVGSTYLEFVAEQQFFLAGGANTLPGSPVNIAAGSSDTAIFTATGWVLTGGASGVASVGAGAGISIGGTAANPVVTNTGTLDVTAGTGIAVAGTAAHPTVSNTGTLDVTAGTGIAVTGSAAHPTVSNTGTLDVTAGAGIAVTGSAAHPIVSATGGGGTLHSQEFTVSGVFTPPVGVTALLIGLCGGGGGGAGGRVGSNAGDFGTGGSGGGGALFSFVQALGALNANPITVTIGAAGGGGAHDADGGEGGRTIVTDGVNIFIDAVGASGGVLGNVSPTASIPLGGAPYVQFDGAVTTKIGHDSRITTQSANAFANPIPSQGGNAGVAGQDGSSGLQPGASILGHQNGGLGGAHHDGGGGGGGGGSGFGNGGAGGAGANGGAVGTAGAASDGPGAGGGGGGGGGSFDGAGVLGGAGGAGQPGYCVILWVA